MAPLRLDPEASFEFTQSNDYSRFEHYQGGLVDDFGQITKVCNWVNGNNGTVDYFRTDASNPIFAIPNQHFGYQSVNHGVGNAYVGIYYYDYHHTVNNIPKPYSEIASTHLVTPLLPNTTYQLKFDASLANEILVLYPCNPIRLQAYLGKEIPGVAYSCLENFPLNPLPDGILLNERSATFDSAGTFKQNDNITTNNNTWDTLVYTFTTSANANQDYLSIGPLKNVLDTVDSSNHANTDLPDPTTASYYYIDNVSLVPLYNASIQLPNEICTTSSPIDLSNYLIGIANGGVFTGDGVTHLGALYSFNPALAGVGSHVINYTSISSAGCPSVVLTRTITVVVPVSVTLSGLGSVCLGDPVTYTASVSGGVWSSSDTSIATINPTTGALTALQTGTFQVAYSVAGSCAIIAPLHVTILNPYVLPIFSFPTTICIGDIPPVLPLISDNNIEGTWSPSVVDNMHTAVYEFKPTFVGACTQISSHTITVISGGHLIANSDILYVPLGVPLSSSILLNDIFNDHLLTYNSLGLTIELGGPSNGFSANQDGTLNILPNLPPGEYHFTYGLSNSCVHTDFVSITIIITEPAVLINGKNGGNVCFSPNQQTTTQSILDNATLGQDIHATASNVTISNVTAMNGYNLDGITINPDGTINIPAGALPGDCTFSYTLCPMGSDTGCADGYFSLSIGTTIRANTDVFTFQTTGAQVPNVSYNIFTNDQYSPDCFLASPNYFLPVDINPGGNAILSGSINYIGNTSDFFNILPNGVVYMFGNNPPIGTYFFSYTICDKQYQNICSTVTSWIDVVGFTNKIANNDNDKINFDNIIIEPNPSDEIFNIHFDKTTSETTTIELFNLLNQKLQHIEIVDINNYELTLNGLPSGTYILKISDRKNFSIKKIIKQ